MTPTPATIKAENITVETIQGEDVAIHLQSNIDNPVYEITKQCNHGAFALDPKSGHLQYRADDGFIGTDRITYIVTNSTGEESLPADVVIAVHDEKNVQKVVEVVIEIPVKPTAEDIVDAVKAFYEELDDIVNGDDDDNNKDD